MIRLFGISMYLEIYPWCWVIGRILDAVTRIFFSCHFGRILIYQRRIWYFLALGIFYLLTFQYGEVCGGLYLHCF